METTNTIVLFLILNRILGVICFERSDFPSDFVFGAGSSAPQVEGAAFEDGRTPSILDGYFLGNLNKTKWERACDGYHKYKEDVKLMVDTGLEAYKFSISWSRLIPNGKGPVNPKAVEYYNNLINELISHGIQPHVMLVHLDIPEALEDEYEGWLSRRIVKDFMIYANVCFREFGDRVLHWTTLNEPNVIIPSAYDIGIYPPYRCSSPSGSCSKGNSTIEPYKVAHNHLLAHASAVKIYREKYQEKQHRYIGLDIFTGWFRPETNTEEDELAMLRAHEFLLGWFMGPLIYGDYPELMKNSVGSRMPSFTKHESELVKNSFDFIGLNCYSSIFFKNNPTRIAMDLKDLSMDSGVSTRYAMRMNEAEAVMQHVLEDFKQNFGNPPIYIYENGMDQMLKGYFMWSFMDTLELLGDDTITFGLYYVDFDDFDLSRYPKSSAQWYSEFLKKPITGDGNDVIVLQLSTSSVAHSVSVSGH